MRKINSSDFCNQSNLRQEFRTLREFGTLNIPALIILLTFIGLGIIYSLVSPPFEAGDESRHYAVVKYMADTGRLPVQDGSEPTTHWEHEGNQPPLYYALAALLTCWIETGSWDDVFWYNPHTTIGDPLRPDNKNITIHPPVETWRGHVLAVHIIRFFFAGPRNGYGSDKLFDSPEFVPRESLVGEHGYGCHGFQSHVHLHLSIGQQ
jgi:hypothetical protein